ncbi:MAG TPA: fumarate hydratase [Clostridiales bacterium]|nr:fumarate hydratase [Clostridiales bacterium]
MKELSCQRITETVERLFIKANAMLPPETAMLIECASETEDSPAGRKALEDLLGKVIHAGLSGLPVCRDSGMAVVFADIGQDVRITGGSFEEAVNQGVRQAYEKGKLRKSVVGDPLRRENTGDNTPAVIHTRIVPGDSLVLTVCPKGFDSENISAMKMFQPSSTADDILSFLVETVSKADSKTCFPIILGVGLGGTLEQAALLAKRALIRPMDRRNPDGFYANLEQKALSRINKLGIGPGGLGGSTTALAVNIEVFPTHVDGLPCVVNASSHAARRAEAVL